MDRGQRPGCAGVLSRPHPFQPPVGSNVGPGCPRTPVSVGVVICVIPTWLKQLPDRALGPLPAPALTAGHTHPRGTPGAASKVGDGRVHPWGACHPTVAAGVLLTRSHLLLVPRCSDLSGRWRWAGLSPPHDCGPSRPRP